MSTTSTCGGHVCSRPRRGGRSATSLLVLDFDPRASIELLEARIAPAAVFTYTDVDSDKVTVTTSKGTNADLSAIITPHLISSGMGMQLQEIDFSSNAMVFAGTNLTVTAKPTTLGGDGFVNIGYLDATSSDGDGADLNLGKVTIHGDLGRVRAGLASSTKLGLQSLTVQSLGEFGVSTQAGGTVISTVLNGLGALHVNSDVSGAEVLINTGNLGSLFIGGSLLGGATASSGRIQVVSGDLGAVKILGDVRASGADESGKIVVTGKIAGIFIGGSLVGGSDGIPDSNGQIRSFGDMGPVKIMHNVLGGTADHSATIQSGGKLASVFIGGSVIGGPGSGSALSAQISSVGDMGAITIGHDLRAGDGDESGKIVSGGKIKSIKIGGSVVGGSGSYVTNILQQGQITAAAPIGSVTITGDLIGSNGPSSGRITGSGTATAPAFGSVVIGGSIRGGAGDASAEIGTAGSIGKVHIGGDLFGGTGNSSGAIYGNTSLGSVTVIGSVIGNFGANSGTIISGGPIPSVSIGHDLLGGTAPFNLAGAISGGHIGAITIGGDIVASSISGVNSSAISATQDIGTLNVHGSIIGNSTNLVVISALGQPSPKAPADVAIKGVHVGGFVELANIEAGYFQGTPLSADAQIGAVTVGGDWVASNLIAGVMNSASSDKNFGDPGDALITGGNAAITSKIASIVIGGQVLGTVGGTDHFGFVAQQIGSFKVGGTAIPLSPTPDHDTVSIGATGDVAIHEV